MSLIDPVDRPLVLAIDDDSTIQLLVKATLEQAGFRVEQAENGCRGLELFEQLQPDMVLMDVMMPEMDGFAASAEIRRRPDGVTVPILMMTGLDDHESIDQAFVAGATDFITKQLHLAWASSALFAACERRYARSPG